MNDPHAGRVFSPDDDPVELIRPGALEAEVIAAQLRSAGIQVVVNRVSPFAGDGGPALGFVEGAPVLVRRADLAAAQTVLDAAESQPITDEELAAQAEAAAGNDFGNGAVV